jgi:uncharacterized protein (DUF488 family)
MKIFTIGFTNKSAEYFFQTLQQADVKRVIDVRLNNRSQLAGFSKKEDLRYFLRTIGAIDYRHEPELAPTKDLLDAYKSNKIDWRVYESGFLDLMAQRKIELAIARDFIDEGCLLCSEDQPQHCHRRLVAEYFQRHWPEVAVDHLL